MEDSAPSFSVGAVCPGMGGAGKLSAQTVLYRLLSPKMNASHLSTDPSTEDANSTEGCHN